MDPGVKGADARTLDELVPLLAADGQPRVAWVMVPAGPITDDTIAGLGDRLSKGDIVIDGGNSNFQDSLRHGERTCGEGHRVHRLRHERRRLGPRERLLPHGRRLTREHQDGATDLRCARARGRIRPRRPGRAPVTTSKMIHNGIEYGMMQSYAEGYAIMEASGLDIDSHAALSAWRQGSVVRSWLLELLVKALEDNPHLEGIKGVAADSGEGRWTVNEAVAHGVAAPVISAALFARFVSQETEDPAMQVVAALRHQFGGHAVELDTPEGEEH